MTRDERSLLIGPPIELELGGVKWRVVFDHLTLLKIEQVSGLDVLNGGLNVYRPDSRTLQTLAQVTLETSETAERGGVLLWRGIGPRALAKLLDGLQRAWQRDMPLPNPNRTESGPSVVTNWLEAWANARQVLSLTTSEWLFLTPRMVQLLSQHHLESVRQNEWMLAQIASSIINWSMGAPRTPVKPDQFMLHPWDKLPEQEQTGEDVLRMFRSFPGMDEAGKKAIDDLLN